MRNPLSAYFRAGLLALGLCLAGVTSLAQAPKPASSAAKPAASAPKAAASGAAAAAAVTAAPAPVSQLVKVPDGRLLAPDIARIVMRGELVVAMLGVDTPPFFYEKKGELVGLEVDLAKSIAKELGVNVRFNRNAKSFNGVVDIIARGEADIALSKLSRTLARTQVISFSQPYLTLNHALLLNRVKFAQFARDRTLPEPVVAPPSAPQPFAHTPNQAGGQGATSGPASRQGRKQIAGFFTPEMSFAMHTLARRQGRSLQALMAESFNDVLRKYGESPIGE